jgi:hypothetical protein
MATITVRLSIAQAEALLILLHSEAGMISHVAPDALDGAEHALKRALRSRPSPFPAAGPTASFASGTHDGSGRHRARPLG